MKSDKKKVVKEIGEESGGRKTSEKSEMSETSVLASERHAQVSRAQPSVPIKRWHRSWHAT